MRSLNPLLAIHITKPLKSWVKSMLLPPPKTNLGRGFTHSWANKSTKSASCSMATNQRAWAATPKVL